MSNAADKGKEPKPKVMSEETCETEARKKGFGKIGAHRCNQEGEPGSNSKADREWSEPEYEADQKKSSTT